MRPLQKARLTSLVGVPLSLFLWAASMSAQNRVLELDGNDSYVELPPNGFSKLTDAIIEGWVKWDRFALNTRFFDFGEQQFKIALSQA